MRISHEMLLEVLADGGFHSGTALGERWGVSRASVANAIAQFSYPGLEIFRVKGNGYRLSDKLYLLERQAILDRLSCEQRIHVADFRIFFSIHSTNAFLLESLADLPSPSGSSYKVCFSEMQTAGRGTKGRHWVSPLGYNIYMSVLRTFDLDPSALSGLGIVVGLAVLRTLENHNVHNVGFKWPNDILIDSKKVAGILLESRSQAFGTTSVVAGIGVNIKLNDDCMKPVNQPWGTIVEGGFNPMDRNKLAGDLLGVLIQLMEEFAISGLAKFLDELGRFDLVRGRRVRVLVAGREIIGKAVNIDHDGRLLVEIDTGIQKFSSGEVTIRHDTEVAAQL